MTGYTQTNVVQMQQRFSNSTEKAFRAVLKSGNSDQIWSFWIELLKNRAISFGIAEYCDSLPKSDEPIMEHLRLACDLVSHPEKRTSKDWFAQIDRLFAEVNSGQKKFEKSGYSDYAGQLRGELGWLCGLLFSELDDAKTVLELGRSILIDGLDQLLDGAGLPSVENLPLLRPLLACWTRCLLLADSTGIRLWKIHTQRQFEWAVLQTLRLTRKDGSAVFDPEFAEKKDSLEFRRQMEQTLIFDSDPLDHAIAQMVLPGRKTVTLSNILTEKIPKPTYCSDWSRFALLRSGWSHDCPALAVSYPNQTCQIELNFKSQPVLSGNWQVELSLNNRRLVPVEGWTLTCEVIEPTHDYIELELALSEGFRLQRHFLLLHEEEILILADSVLQTPTCQKNRRKVSGCLQYQLQYQSWIPLASLIDGKFSAPDGTERVLSSLKSSKETPLTRVFPLGLPEWTSQLADEGFQIDQNSLKLNQFSSGTTLFAPLLFDLSGSRIRHSYTWRRLTVGEKLEIVSPQQAVGFRIQLCKDQFLFYRSLTEQPANRTVLGHNLVSDLFFGRFSKQEGVETILDVELDEDQAYTKAL